MLILSQTEPKRADAHMPNTSATPLVRTDFSDDVAWEAVTAAIGNSSEDGFIADVHTLSEKEFEGAGAEQLANLDANANHAVIFIADQITMNHPDRPLLCVEVAAPERMFRVVPSALWSAENNLSLANLDFADFLDSVGGDGIFRGF
jgi:hypothetical protein